MGRHRSLRGRLVGPVGGQVGAGQLTPTHVLGQVAGGTASPGNGEEGQEEEILIRPQVERPLPSTTVLLRFQCIFQ